MSADLAVNWGEELVLVVADGCGDGEHGDVSIVDLGRPLGGRLGRMLIGGARALRYVMRIRPRVVHFHDPELIPVGLCSKLLGVKVIYDVHEWVPNQIMQKHWMSWWLRRPVAFAVKGVEYMAGRYLDRIVAATPTIGLHFPEEKTILVQNFPMREEIDQQGAREYKNRPPEFAYVGGITRIRAGIEMVEALEAINMRKNARLHMAGSFRPADFEKEIISTKGWEFVEFHGWVGRQEMSDILGRVLAGLVLFYPTPNNMDSQPNKLFEYMAAGIPVIASDFPLWRGLIEELECGILVDPQSVEDIAAAMEWILDNPEEAQRMGDNGLKAVQGKYNWCTESEKLIKMYENLIGKAPNKMLNTADA